MNEIEKHIWTKEFLKAFRASKRGTDVQRAIEAWRIALREMRKITDQQWTEIGEWFNEQRLTDIEKQFPVRDIKLKDEGEE